MYATTDSSGAGVTELESIVASSPVPLFFTRREAPRALRGEEKIRAWYTLFAHASKSHRFL